MIARFSSGMWTACPVPNVARFVEQKGASMKE